MPRTERKSSRSEPTKLPGSFWLLSSRSGKLAGAVLIAVVAFLVYLPALAGGPLLDDDELLAKSPVMVAPDGLYRIWFTTDAPDYWPLTNTMFWLECRLWGNRVDGDHALNTVGYHAVNLALHIAAAFLIWKILAKLAIPGAFFAALLFTVHPVNVESVAWMSQRKNTLSMVFFLISVLWWLKADDAVEAGGDRTSEFNGEGGAGDWNRNGIWNRWYFLSLAAFVLALLSKGSVAVLPAVLALITWWRRPIVKTDVMRLTPFFVVAVIFVGVNMWFQAHANAEVIRHATILERLLGAGAAVWFYLYKAILPFDLAFVYPMWHIDTSNVLWWLPLIAAVVVTAILWRERQTKFGRPLFFTWVYFCIALLPVLGFADVGYMKFSLVADHYQYIAVIGVVALASAAIFSWRRHATGATKDLPIFAAIGIATLLAALAWEQCGQYTDAITLYRTAIEKNPDCWMLHGNLGDALYEAKKNQAAIPELRTALRMYPDSDDAHLFLARSLRRMGDSSQSVENYEEALRLRPDNIPVARELADYYLQMGRTADAMATADHVLEFARKKGSDDLIKQVEQWKAMQENRAK